jgi:nitrous oxide reductase accessory protein NosL
MLFSLLFGIAASTEDLRIPQPEPDAVCPVCGMFVSKYPEWVATVVFADGTARHFDGAKDLFKFILDPGKYAPGRRRDEVAGLAVTEYYDLRRIDAQAAYYVIGSDVLGPMGHELVPLASEDDARAFAADHDGVGIVRFDAVTLPLLRRLDAGEPKRALEAAATPRD